MRKRKLKAIDLFAGVGGFSLGLQQAGLDVVAAVEIDKYCVETLTANKATSFPKMKIIQADICTLSGEYLLKKVGLAKGQLDMLVGGPPCQGFSTSSSTRSTTDPRSKLMWQFVRMVKEIQPRHFVIENVQGLLNFKDFFRLLLKSLEKYGYVVRFNLLDCASYGIPQRRHRVLIEGARNDLNIIPKYPAPTHFDLGKKQKGDIPAWLVAKKCFATHGFSKAEVDDVWWNTKLEIMMNRKTAAEMVNQAVNEILLETLLTEVNAKNQKGDRKMAKAKQKDQKKSVTKPKGSGEQLVLIDVQPENAKPIIRAARIYKEHQAVRLSALAKEKEHKQKVLELVKEAKLQPLKDGVIKFTYEGVTVTIEPQR